MTAAVILLVIANALAILWCVGTVGRVYDMMHTIYNALKAQKELNEAQAEMNEAQQEINDAVIGFIYGRRRKEGKTKTRAMVSGGKPCVDDGKSKETV